MEFRSNHASMAGSGRCLRTSLVLLACGLAAACSGGGGRDVPGFIGGGSGGGGGGSGAAWTPGVFAASQNFEALCANPRSGNDPQGNPWPDRQGTVLDENNFLRSFSDETYLWYDEIPDQDPGLFSDPLVYFDELVTPELTASGNRKDQFHFTFDTDEWIALSQSGVSAGYGVQFAILASRPPRQIVVAYTDPGTPAATNALARGAELVSVNGIDVVNDDTQAGVDLLNAALFPSGAGETYTFEVRDLGSATTRTFDMTSAVITSTPVQNVGTVAGNPDVGYLLFNDHIATAEQGLVNAINALQAAGVTDLVLDMRYNGGGFLAIAAELAYMIAGPTATAGRTFELQQFNDKNPVINPITGQTIQPIPFLDETQNFSLPSGQPLPTLNLDRVFVLTGGGTCSASEALMNGLRGVDVDVIQIGTGTCGKPYGFYAEDNCGTTYFTIQFRGVNDKNYGDYADGFTPSPSATIDGNIVPGCEVGDDFSNSLGDPAEAQLSAALFYRDNGACPAPSPATLAPEKARLTLTAEQSVALPKPAWRTMRVVRQP